MNYFTFKYSGGSALLYSAQRDITTGHWIIMWQMGDKCRYMKYTNEEIDYYIDKGLWVIEENIEVTEW